MTSVRAVHRKPGTLSSMRLQKGKQSLYNMFSLNRKSKLKSKRKKKVMTRDDNSTERESRALVRIS